jgi:hypothetical protein
MDRRSAQAAGKRLTVPLPAASLLIATIFLALPANAQTERWRRDKPCGERQPSMVAVDVKGCHRAWCSETVLGRLCACVKDDGERTQFLLERTDGARETWEAPFIPPMGGDTGHFRIDRVGDGRLFFAVMGSESVGIAISTWTVWAIDRDRTSKPLEVQNYGTVSFATMARSGTPCYLLAARWHSGWEPRRGHGTYITGSWYAIEDGAFTRTQDRPAIYRRYLFDVERARYEAEARGHPLPWYRGASAVVGPRPLTGRAL